MLKEIDGRLVQIRASGFSDLLKVVIEQFQLHCDTCSKIQKQFGYIPESKVLQQNGYNVKSVSIIAQTFTAMTVEAFYFDYYLGRNSKGKAEKWSQQSPIKQFEQLSVNYLNQQNFEELELYIKLRDLNKVRKHWIHNKSTDIGKYSKDLSFLSADGCIQLLREFFEYFSINDENCTLSKVTYSILSEIQKDTKGYNEL
ncbi:hypothetical protein L2729_20310 [Shewanella gelidimarina]|uniref:hypothetical protein n=1 Tax=Shewanella gelidimarina TaxID=56813 RepID=UPI00200EBC8C|nr:hypothetical protein [Shewanella gelidimarina]MCL1060311.1 hypothetical protein [Shewanella gelidimarina]